MDKFEKVCAEYGPRLIRDLKITAEDAAAILGNGGHESAGFMKLQEVKPTVKGSRGGYGWFQWTGPRRRNFEAFCSRNGLEPTSDKANYAFLLFELRGSQKKAVGKVKAAGTLYAKMVAFELAYERAGIKHYDSRLRYASLAIDIINKNGTAEPALGMAAIPRGIDKPMVASKTNWLAGIGAGLSSVTAFFSGLHPVIQGMIIVLAVGVAGYILYERRQKAIAVRETEAVVDAA